MNRVDPVRTALLAASLFLIGPAWAAQPVFRAISSGTPPAAAPVTPGQVQQFAGRAGQIRAVNAQRDQVLVSIPLGQSPSAGSASPRPAPPAVPAAAAVIHSDVRQALAPSPSPAARAPAALAIPEPSPPPPPAPASTPDDVAQQLTARFYAMRGVSPNGADVARLQQPRAIRVTVPEALRQPAPPSVPAAASPARFATTSVYGKRLFSLDTYREQIQLASVTHGVDEALIRAVIHAESAYKPWVVSHAGAGGLMQLMPATAARFGVNDRFDAAENINAGTRYLAWLLKRYNGDVTLATAAYNAGEGAVDRHNGVPPYRETRGYVVKVADLFQHYSLAINGTVPLYAANLHAAVASPRNPASYAPAVRVISRLAP